MRAITIAAIAAAAAVGIASAAFMLYAPGATEADVGDPPATADNRSNISIPPAVDSYKQINVTVNGIHLVTDIASTGDQRSKGLSVKDDLKENEAMLFVFSKESEHGFYMKGMKFPIDIIWLDSNMEVVHIEHSLEPCGPDSCPTYRPDSEALYVLETVAGFAVKYDVVEGTLVEFDPSLL
ncbi:MAG TPA: DUF192 domain-containing protein [Nitrososphaera sp.]